MKVIVSQSTVIPFKKKEKPEVKKPEVKKHVGNHYMEAVYTFDPEEDNSKWVKMAQQARTETMEALNGPRAVEAEKPIIMILLDLYRLHHQALVAKTEEEFNRVHDLIEPLQIKVQKMYADLRKKK
jgi:hypothetical protein